MFQLIKQYMPKRLYWRAAFILLLPVVLLQLIVTAIFVQRHFQGVTEQMTKTMSAQIQYIQDTIDSDGFLRAQQIASSLNMQLSIVNDTTFEPPNTRRFYDISGIIVKQELMKNDTITDIDLPTDGELILWFYQDKTRYRLKLKRASVSASNPHQLIVYIVVLGALFSVIAFFYLRNQLRPITRLAAAAEAFGRGQVVPYSPSGAIEVRAAGQAFLDMRARIDRYIEQRTMILSGVSHDLRTPLTRLKLGLSLIDVEEREPLERDLDEMQQMLDEFLAFAKVQGGETSAFEDTNVIDLINTIKSDFERSGHMLDVDMSLTKRFVPMRSALVKRALENLINNAFRYGRKAKISVTSSEKFIEFWIEDNGIGIAPEYYAEALKPFSRLDPARNQNSGMGVGLGLPIAADVARGHGGKLTLHKSSQLGGLLVKFRIAIAIH